MTQEQMKNDLEKANKSLSEIANKLVSVNLEAKKLEREGNKMQGIIDYLSQIIALGEQDKVDKLSAEHKDSSSERKE